MSKDTPRTQEKNTVTNATLPEPDYLTVAEVAARLGLSKMTVYRMCDNGDLAHIRTGQAGRCYRILRTSYEQHASAFVAPAPAVIPGQTEITE